MQVRTLTRDVTSIWNGRPGEVENISIATMRTVMRQHLCQFEPAWVESDMCVYCVDLKQKVLPEAKRLVKRIRDKLEEFMPGYFARFDDYAATASVADRPGLELREVRHFIENHSEQRPCPKHRGTGFPRLRVGLNSVEAQAIGVKLQAMSKLLDGYIFHRAANEHPKANLGTLLEEPQVGYLFVLSDWKELFTLPARATRTGESFLR